MSNRTIFGLSVISFAFGIGLVIAYRLPEDGLTAITAMILTGLFSLLVVAVVMAIMGWTVVQLRRPHDGDDGGRPGQPVYPPVMIFGQPSQAVLPPDRNGYEAQLPAGPRQFTIIGDSGDEYE